ncbi:hypothetical protein FACS1894116_01460 [Betaproteobacteria bacterium]|nr:hypothetical protein FACS1894116_01460 [Betaproteobacteria bacterium]GHU24935.1 hypothetical protein FACS189488_10710 [Betaproteobacteria bacterium]GHU28468.1 hypothetical protein FACS189497_04000 [Betaproteobacteria bacterium]
MNVKQKLGLVAVGSAALMPGFASAAGLSDLTSAIDFADVGTAVLAIGAALAGIYVLWKGAGLILSAIRGL